MQKEIERLEVAVEANPAFAIGTAKDLFETCRKSILTRQGISFLKTVTLADRHHRPHRRPSHTPRR